MAKVTVSEKGSIVLPKEIRKHFGLKKGDQLNILDFGRGIYLFPAPDDPIAASFGLLKDGPSLTEALLEDRRKEREREEREMERFPDKLRKPV